MTDEDVPRKAKATPSKGKPKSPSLRQVGTQADAGDETAMRRLADLSTANGLNPDDYNTWAELAEALNARRAASAEAMPPSRAAVVDAPARGGTSGLAIASFVLGLLWIAGFGSLLAIIFGFISRRNIKRSNGRIGGGGLATAGIVLGILGIIGAILMIVALAAVDEALEDVVNQTDANPTACVDSATYPDQQDSDCVAGEDGRIGIFGFTVTASNLHRVAPGFEGDTGGLCADVSMTNSSDESLDYNEFDYKLQVPAGDVRSFDLVVEQENGLGSGVLVAGGSKSGTVCFEDPGGTGQFVLIYKPDAFDDARGIWLFTIA